MPGIKPRMTGDRRSAKPATKPSAIEGNRIAKVMARAGLCSRREAEAWIAAGRVSVNGAAISSPALNVTAKDKIVVDGKAMPVRERTRLFLYNKPRGLVTTHADPEKRPTIFEQLPETMPRVISVGRLDLNTEGLLLLTNDGGLARVLELPETGWLRRYRVRAHGSILQPQLDALRKGVTIDGMRYGAIEATVDRMQGANVWLTFAIREGKNREVRNVLEHLGLKVNRLIRVSFGPFQLGDLKEGAVEEIRTRHLREQLGDRIVEKADADFSGPMTELLPAAPVKDIEREPRPERGERTGGKSRDDGGIRAPTRPASPATLPRKRGRDKEETPRRTSSHSARTPRRTNDDARPPRRDTRNRDEKPARGPKPTSKPRRGPPDRGKRKR